MALKIKPAASRLRRPYACRSVAEDKYMRLLLVTVLICLGLANPASARTVFPIYGGQGDNEVVDECPAGSFLVGLVGNVGSWIDQITVICGKQRPDGSISGSDSLPSPGGSGGSFKSVLCGRDEVVSEISPHRTKLPNLRNCHDVCEREDAHGQYYSFRRHQGLLGYTANA